MDLITREMRMMQWTPIIQECRNSNMTVKAWCQNNNVNQKQFYYWQRRIREAAYETFTDSKVQGKPSFVQLPVASIPQINSGSFTADMIIQVGSNRLELSNTTSENLLSMVLSVISNAE
jgi:putative transposase